MKRARKQKTDVKISIKSSLTLDIIVQFDSFEIVENCDHERSSGIFRLVEFLALYECCEWTGEKLLDVQRFH